MNEFFTTRHVNGRKPYKCQECYGGIYQGENHVIYSGKWDGEFFCVRSCNCCYQLRAAAEKATSEINDPDNPVCFGELHQYLKDCNDPGVDELKARSLEIKARRKHIWELIKAGQKVDPATGPLVYTSAQPTAPGWYWWRRKDHKDKIVRVEDTNKPGLLWCEGQFQPQWVEAWPSAERAGPIQPPKNAQT